MNDNTRAAAERIVNAPTYWTGSVLAGPGYVDIEIEDAVRVAAAYLERERQLDELRGYLKHKRNCPASATTWMKNESGHCDCGLDALIKQMGLTK